MARTRVRAEFQVNNLDDNDDPVFIRTNGSVQLLNDLDANTFKIVNLGDPTNDNDLINKQHLDFFFAGLDQKESVKAATDQNIDLSGPPKVVDGVDTGKDDRILVHNQTDAVQNGIYVVDEAAVKEGNETIFQSTNLDDPNIESEAVSGGPDIQHHAVIDRDNGRLAYAIKQDGTWAVETVDNIAHDSIDLAVTSDGEPHIIAQSGGTNYHYVKSGGSWTSMNGFTSPTLYNPSIELDSSGNPYVSGSEGGLGNALGVASKPSSTWNQETVDSNAQTQSNDIVLDSTDNVHVAYRDDSTTSGKYAFNDGAWATETYSDANRNDGMNCGIDVDPSDNPHISHYGEYAIWHSYNDGVSWNLEKVAGTGETGSDIDTFSSATDAGSPNFNIASTAWSLLYSFVYEGSEVIPQSNVSPDFDIASTSWFLVYNAEYTGHEVIIQSETAPDFEIASTSWVKV